MTIESTKPTTMVIDHTAFPEIIDRIVKYLKPAELLTARLVSKDFRHKVNRIMCWHVALKKHGHDTSMCPPAHSWAGTNFLALPFAPEAVQIVTLNDMMYAGEQFLPMDLAARFTSCRMLRRDTNFLGEESHARFPVVCTVVDQLFMLRAMTPSDVTIVLPPTTLRYVLKLHWGEGYSNALSSSVSIKNSAKVTNWVVVLSSDNVRREPILPITQFTTVLDILVAAIPSLLACGSLTVVGLERILPDQIGGPPHVKGRRGADTFTLFKSILKNAVASSSHESSLDAVLQATKSMSREEWDRCGALESSDFF